jgi:hypothetical protein
MVLGGRKTSLAEQGPERVQIWPSGQDASSGNGWGGNMGAELAQALNGIQLTLVVDGKQLDAYLQARDKRAMYKERLRS